MNNARFIDAGDDIAAVDARAHRPGGPPYDMTVADVWTVREAWVTRIEAYIGTPAMLKALGFP